VEPVMDWMTRQEKQQYAKELTELRGRVDVLEDTLAREKREHEEDYVKRIVAETDATTKGLRLVILEAELLKSHNREFEIANKIILIEKLFIEMEKEAEFFKVEFLKERPRVLKVYWIIMSRLMKQVLALKRLQREAKK
jgi:glutamate synthase domain-containing protein 1